jgi:predicted ATPase
MFARVMLAWDLWILGQADQAAQIASEGVILARGLSHPNSLGFALAMTASLDQYRGDEAAAERHGAELVTLCQEQGLAHWLGLGHILHGWALKERGEIAPGLEEMNAGRVTWRMIGARVADSHWDCMLAESLLDAGKAAEAKEILDATVTYIEESDERSWEPEVARLRGRLAMAIAKDAAAAEAHMRRAIEIAASRGARAHELRAAMSLCVLLRGEGRGEEGRIVLGVAYAKMKEGLATDDAKRAKALLAGER